MVALRFRSATQDRIDQHRHNNGDETDKELSAGNDHEDNSALCVQVNEERLDQRPRGVCRDDDTECEKQGDAGNMAVSFAEEPDLIHQEGVWQEAPAHKPEEAEPEQRRLPPRLPGVKLDSCREQDGKTENGICREADDVSGFHHVLQPTFRMNRLMFRASRGI